MCEPSPIKVWHDDLRNTESMYPSLRSMYESLRCFKNAGLVPLIVSEYVFGSQNSEREVSFMYRGRGKIWEFAIWNIPSDGIIFNAYIDNANEVTKIAIDWLNTGDTEKVKMLIRPYVVVRYEGKWVKKNSP